MYCDNKSVIALCCNIVKHQRKASRCAMIRYPLLSPTPTPAQLENDSGTLLCSTNSSQLAAPCSPKRDMLLIPSFSIKKLNLFGEDVSQLIFCPNKVDIELNHTFGCRCRHGILFELKAILLNVSPMDNNPINSSTDEEGGTTVVGCNNDASIKKFNGLETLEKEIETRVSNKTPPCETVKSVRYKKMTRSIRKDSSRQDFQSQENV
ncbi:hypothetical protein Tco_0015116 [Tanacetum coccineum]